MNRLRHILFSAVSLLACFTLMLCGIAAKAQSLNTPACVEEQHNYICGFVHDESGQLVRKAIIRILYTNGSQLPGKYDTVAITRTDTSGHFVIVVPDKCTNPRLSWLVVDPYDNKSRMLRLADMGSFSDLNIEVESDLVFSHEQLIICRQPDVVEVINVVMPGTFYDGQSFDRRGGMNGVWRDLMPAPGSEIRR